MPHHSKSTEGAFKYRTGGESGTRPQLTPGRVSPDGLDALAGMNANCTTASGYELRFRSLLDTGREYSFPCDASGRVDLDAASERMRNTYFYLRVVIGRKVALPAVHAVTRR